jgi:TetR/AcrR family transcriptional repressor of lmrAB and yxaGH operons
MSPQDRSRETQDRLLATTAALLAERGYHGAGLSEILRDSGVPKGSLYHHFPAGKAQLAAASLRLTGGRVVARLEQFADRAGSVADGIRAFCDMYIAELRASDYRRGCPLATVAVESAGLDDGVHAEVGVAMAAMVDLLTARITAEAPASADPRGLATEVVAAVEGALLLAKATRSTGPVETVRDRLTARVTEELRRESP